MSLEAPRVALVTGATGLVGRALVRRLRDDGVRVLATARTFAAERAVRELGAEPLHTDLANIGSWQREAADAEAIFHLGLPRLQPPLRRAGAWRRARAAAGDASALAAVAGGRPVVMLSTGLLYAPGPRPAADDDPLGGGVALARAAGAAERALAGPGLRVVRAPWVHGPGGLLRDLVEALRARRFRVVGAGDNPWAMLGHRDAADALVAALAAPPGAYSAAEDDVPTQQEVVDAVCSVPGHRRPDHLPRAMATLSMGGAMSQALSAPLLIRTGRLADHGFRARQDWRAAVVSLAEGPLPGP